jgi:hypothetical protein
MDEIKLCFIKYIGLDLNGLHQYEFLFSDKIDEVWGENFEVMPAGLCNDLTPNQEDYCAVKNISLDVKINLIQDSCCFSMQDCMDGIISLGYAYQNDKLILDFKYGDTLNDVEKKLANINTYFI